MSSSTTNTQIKFVSRSQARKWTLCAQFASAVFVLGAVAVGVVGLPELKSPSSTNASGGDSPGLGMGTNPGFTGTPGMNNAENAGSGDQSTGASDVDTLGLALRLALLDNAPEIEIEIPTSPGAIAVDPAPSSSTDDLTGSIVKRVRYIGFIRDPKGNHAFIRIDGKQRVVTKGGMAKAGNDSMPDLKVEKVTSQAIILSDGQVRSRVPLADRNGPSITMAGGGKVEVAAAAESGSLLTEEDEARIEAMPPRQRTIARRRLERERRGLPPDKVRRRPLPEPQVTVTSSFNKKKKNE